MTRRVGTYLTVIKVKFLGRFTDCALGLKYRFLYTAMLWSYKEVASPKVHSVLFQVRNSSMSIMILPFAVLPREKPGYIHHHDNKKCTRYTCSDGISIRQWSSAAAAAAIARRHHCTPLLPSSIIFIVHLRQPVRCRDFTRHSPHLSFDPARCTCSEFHVVSLGASWPEAPWEGNRWRPCGRRRGTRVSWGPAGSSVDP